MVIKKACREDTKKNRDRKRDNIYIEREKTHRWRDIKREKRDTGKRNKNSREREREEEERTGRQQGWKTQKHRWK
jgi:hypothetical protein